MCGIACPLTTPTSDHYTHSESFLIELIYRNLLTSSIMFLWYLCMFDLSFVSYIVFLLVSRHLLVQLMQILRYFGSEWASLVRHKIGCHGNFPWGIGKTGPDQENSRKYLPFGKTIVKIGLVDTEIALLRVKKIKKKKLTQAKYNSPSRQVCRAG